MINVRVLSVVVIVAGLAIAFWKFAPRETAQPSGPAAPAAKPKADEVPPVSFGIYAPIADRFVREPCNQLASGGFFSMAAVQADMERKFPDVVGLSMGDLTLAWGGMAAHTSAYHYSEIFPQTGIHCVGAGEGELGLGVDFLRELLTRVQGVNLLCANATDAEGRPLLRGRTLLKSRDRGVLVVAVASQTLEPEIRNRGSAVRLVSPVEAASKALSEGMEQAKKSAFDVEIKVLLVHGTVAEGIEILDQVPGFTFAAAAHGGVLADAEPRLSKSGAPVFYAGQGMRFVWRTLVPAQGQPLDWSLARVGVQMLAKASPYAESLGYFRELSASKLFADSVRDDGGRMADPRGAYVGAKRCASCHGDIAEQHAASPHGVPSAALLDSPYATSTGCMNCHVTAPYSKDGWTGPADRSDLAAISCEVCHGPGEAHCTTQSPDYGKLSFDRCRDCHLPDHSPEFDPEAIWKRAGHKLR